MAYQVPEDFLQSQLIKAIFENQPVAILDRILENYIRGMADAKPISLGEDISTDAGKKAFWKKFLNQKIKIFNSQYSVYSVELSPIHIAARTGSHELVKYLLNQYPEENKTPLITAPIATHSLMGSEVVTIDDTDYYGASNAFLLAITHGNIEVANYLYRLNSSLATACDVQLNTPLHWTTRLGYHDEIRLPQHQEQNANREIPDRFSTRHYQQQALNTIRNARKKKKVQDSIDLQNIFIDLEKNLHTLDGLIKELNPSDIDRTNKIAALTNGIVSDIIDAKINNTKLKEGRIDEYNREIAQLIHSLRDYDDTSKKLLIALVTVLAITITILLALTVFGILAEIAGASFYAGFSAAASQAAVLGSVVEVTTSTGAAVVIAGEGAASAAWIVGIPVAGSASLYFSDRYTRGQGQRTMNAIEENVKAIKSARVALG